MATFDDDKVNLSLKSLPTLKSPVLVKVAMSGYFSMRHTPLLKAAK